MEQFNKVAFAFNGTIAYIVKNIAVVPWVSSGLDEFSIAYLG